MSSKPKKSPVFVNQFETIYNYFNEIQKHWWMERPASNEIKCYGARNEMMAI